MKYGQIGVIYSFYKRCKKYAHKGLPVLWYFSMYPFLQICNRQNSCMDPHT